MRRTSLLLIPVLMVLVLGCGGEEANTGGPFDVEALIAGAAQAMGGIESARFSMEREGAPVEISGLEFASAEGAYLAPASAKAILRVKAADLSVELGTIAVEDRVWLTNPLTGGWEEIAPGTGFNIAIVFDPEVGWVPLLTDDLSGVEYLGVRSDGSGDRHVIHGTIAASRVEFLTAGLVEAQAVEADIWIHPESKHITRVEFATTIDDAETDWIIRLSDFDEPVTVEAPTGF